MQGRPREDRDRDASSHQNLGVEEGRGDPPRGLWEPGPISLTPGLWPVASRAGIQRWWFWEAAQEEEAAEAGSQGLGLEAQRKRPLISPHGFPGVRRPGRAEGV